MASELYSSDALTELRRILLSRDILIDALRPLLSEMLRERSAQLAHDVMEELAPTVRAAVREALQNELRELSPEVASELVSALEPSLDELVHQKLAQAEVLADLQAKTQAALDRIAAVEEALRAEPPAPSAATPDRNSSAPRGCRRLLVLGLALMMTIISTSWGWSRVDVFGELLSGHGIYQGVVMAASGDEQQRPQWTLTSPGVVSPEGEIVTMLPSGTSEPQTPSTATPTLPATPTPTVKPVASIAQSSPTPQLMQAEVEESLPQSAAVSVSDALWAAQESLAASQVYESASETFSESASESVSESVSESAYEGVAEAKPLAETPASDEPSEPAEKVLYLTFDDGPNGLWTPQILEILAQYDAYATFFVIGKEAAKRPELVRAVVDAGHVVAHHTWSHSTLLGLDRATFEAEIENTSRVVEGAISPYLRAPGGAIDAEIRAYADELGLEIVHWDIDPSDWKLPPAEEIASMVIRRAGPGKIVLLHDGGGDRSQTVAALPIILETLREQGYVFKSID